MRVFDFLFYKSYELNKRANDLDSTPVFRSIAYLYVCSFACLLPIFSLMEDLFNIKIFNLLAGWRTLLFLIGLYAFIYFCYSYKRRYRKVIEHYEAQTGWKKKIHPAIVTNLYLVISLCFMLLYAIFRDKYWIFAR
jgi:hypothetical protein